MGEAPGKAPAGAGRPPRRVLITNDDGWEAPGLRALVEVFAPLARPLVVAPAEERSGVGQAITLRGGLTAEPRDLPPAAAGYVVHGTPADCAKLAIRSLFAADPPALSVSGLNCGPNVGVNVFYSGTVGAALESVVNGVPAIAVSKEFGERLGPREAAGLLAPLFERVLETGLPPWHALNINIPDRPAEEVRGLRLTRHGVSGFDERYRETTTDACLPQRSFRLEGEMRLRETDGLTDAEAVAAGFVSVTPMMLDLTSRTCGAPDERWHWIAAVGLGR